MHQAGYMNAVSLRTNMPDVSPDLAQMFFCSAEFVGLKVRSIAIHDAGEALRRKWLMQIFRMHQPLDFSESPEILLSNALSHFDVILISGDDIDSICSFVAEHRPMMLGRAKICVCTSSRPEHNARLILAGFDEVVAANDMQPLEFVARLFAIWGRYRNNRISGTLATDLETMIHRVAQATKLAPKNRAVLRQLLQSSRHEASYAALCAAAGTTYAPIGFQNLKVRISRIRKLLKPGFQLVHHEGSGYGLIGPEPDWHKPG